MFEKNAKGHFVDKDVSRVMIGLGKAQGRRLRDTADNDRLYFPAPYAAQFLSDVALKLGRLDD
eukprot:COSAG01_NODE_56956_length_315_cov_0.791667_1_plen_62_part_10